ncbi:MAG: hypothetical protein OJF47_004184 [Nitrospira sp.]|nr:MAG: hypothetical protein OJF47_004184 [Nitrospira sp.]
MVVHVRRRSDGEVLHHRPYRRLPPEQERASVRGFSVDRFGEGTRPAASRTPFCSLRYRRGISRPEWYY